MIIPNIWENKKCSKPPTSLWGFWDPQLGHSLARGYTPPSQWCTSGESLRRCSTENRIEVEEAEYSCTCWTNKINIIYIYIISTRTAFSLAGMTQGPSQPDSHACSHHNQAFHTWHDRVDSQYSYVFINYYHIVYWHIDWQTQSKFSAPSLSSKSHARGQGSSNKYLLLIFTNHLLEHHTDLVGGCHSSPKKNRSKLGWLSSFMVFFFLGAIFFFGWNMRNMILGLSENGF